MDIQIFHHAKVLKNLQKQSSKRNPKKSFKISSYKSINTNLTFPANLLLLSASPKK
jgi:hypothetical protein